MKFTVNWKRSALAVYLLLSASSCSSRKSDLIDLPFENSQVGFQLEAAPDTERTLVLRKENSDLAGYVTGLKSCGYPEKASLKGNVRQIFVGLEKLKIHRQEYIEVAPRRLLKVEADAESDGLPISLTTYTYKDDGCFYDFVLWVAAQNPPEDFDSQLNDLRTHFGSFVTEALPKI